MPPETDGDESVHPPPVLAVNDGARGGRVARLDRVARHVVLVQLLAGGFLWMAWDPARIDALPMLDEYGWTAASDLTFRLACVDRDFSRDGWMNGFQAATYGSLNPTIAKLVMGFALHRWGYDLPPPSFFPNSPTATTPAAATRAARRTPGRGAIAGAAAPAGPRTFREMTRRQWSQVARAHVPYILRLRWLCLFVGAAAAVVLFHVGRALCNVTVGLLAYLAYITTPVVRSEQWIVYTDNFLMLTTLLAVWLCALFLRRWCEPEPTPSPIGTFAYGALTALALGCAAATKLNGGLLTAVWLLAAAALAVVGPFGGRGRWKSLLVVVGVAGGSVATFLLLNPFFWHDTVQRTLNLFHRWGYVIAYQRDTMPWFAVSTLGRKIALVFDRALVDVGPLSCASAYLPAALGWVGLVIVAVRWIHGIVRRRAATGACLLFTWTAVVTIATTAWLPLDWARYYLPIVPCVCLLQAVALDAPLRAMAKIVRSRPVNP